MCNYSLGYIYENFAQALSDKRCFENEDYTEYMLGNSDLCKEKAMDYYQDAFIYFRKVNHVVGKYLSKHGRRRNIDEYSSINSVVNELKSEENDQFVKMQDYGKEFGFEQSCFIAREHGDGISLMAEIVESEPWCKLFPNAAESDIDEEDTEEDTEQDVISDINNR